MRMHNGCCGLLQFLGEQLHLCGERRLQVTGQEMADTGSACSWKQRTVALVALSTKESVLYYLHSHTSLPF
jgi:hypothetical protein